MRDARLKIKSSTFLKIHPFLQQIHRFVCSAQRWLKLVEKVSRNVRRDYENVERSLIYPDRSRQAMQEWHKNGTPRSFQQLNFQSLFHSPETNRLTCASESMPNLPSRNVHFDSPPTNGSFRKQTTRWLCFCCFFSYHPSW